MPNPNLPRKPRLIVEHIYLELGWLEQGERRRRLHICYQFERIDIYRVFARRLVRNCHARMDGVQCRRIGFTPFQQVAVHLDPPDCASRGVHVFDFPHPFIEESRALVRHIVSHDVFHKCRLIYNIGNAANWTRYVGVMVNAETTMPR